jgi:DNA replication licensing factor MCM7
LQSFLKDFKTTPAQTLATALGNITIDENDLSDDDLDLMDGDDEAAERRRQEREQRRQPKHTYLETLKNVANRTQDTIVIDLDDLASVCSFRRRYY